MSVDPMDVIVPILAPGHTAAELAASPSPDALPDAAVTSSVPVVDLRLAGLVSAMREVAGRLELAAFEAGQGPNGAYEFFVDLEKDLGTWAQDIRDAIREVLS